MRKLVAVAVLLAAVIVAQQVAHAQIKFGSFTLEPAQQTQEQELPDVKHRVLRGDEWLGGKGVDVFYKNGTSCDFSCSQELKPLKTCAFQCVDLAVRLYAKVGYPNWSFKRRDTPIGSAVQMADIARQRPMDFEDLEFYPNDGTATRPPAPGNLLIFAADGSNENHGHVAVVDEVAGGVLSFVQQNLCHGGRAVWSDLAFIEVALKQGQQTFRVVPQKTYSAVVGWIHSKRVKEGLIDQPHITPGEIGDLSWNADDATIYLYLSPKLTRLHAFDEPDFASTVLADLPSRALAFTDFRHVRCVLEEAQRWISKDRRLNPRNGVRSVDIAIKYTGYMHWLRPWGGPASKKWIPFTTDCLMYPPA